MTAKELRRAAERLETTPPSELDYRELMEIHRYILTNVQEDGEEKLDESVIREYGFVWDEGEEALCLEHNGDIYEMYQCGAGWKLYWSEIESWPKVITTRSQFRTLCHGLGIEPRTTRT